MDGMNPPKRTLEAADNSRAGKRFQPDGFGSGSWNGSPNASFPNATISNAHISDPSFFNQIGYGLSNPQISQSALFYPGNWSLSERSFNLSAVGNPGVDPRCAVSGSEPFVPAASQDICYGMVRFLDANKTIYKSFLMCVQAGRHRGSAKMGSQCVISSYPSRIGMRPEIHLHEDTAKA